MKKYFIVIILIFSASFILKGQNIHQKSDVNTENYPELSVKINIYNPNLKKANDFKIFEDTKSKTFSLKEITDYKEIDTTKAILILLEDMTHISHAGQLDFYKELLNKSLAKFVNKNDKVNIAVFDRNRDGNSPLRFLNEKYTDNTQILLQKINDYKSINDYQSNNQSSDLYNALYDGMNDLRKNYSEKNKIILVLSAAYNFETTNENTQESLINFSGNNKIPVYSIQYRIWENRTINRLANESFGKFFISIDKNREIATDSCINFMKNAVYKLYGRDYLITFDTENKKDGKLHTFNIEIENTKFDIQYKSPDCNIICYAKYNPLIAAAIILLFLTLIFFIYKFITKNNEKKAAEAKIKEELYQKELKNQKLKIEKVQAENLENIKRQEEKFKYETQQKELVEEIKKQKEQELKNIELQEQAQARIIKEMKNNGFPKIISYSINDEAEFVINKPVILIGRDVNCDIIIDDLNVSRKHFYIKYINNTYIITDNQSTNGIAVNGKKVQESQLKHNDIIELGPVRIKFIK